MIRMEVFISPLEDVFLSAHGTVGGKPIPKAIPEDEVLKASPLNVSVPPGRFVLLKEDIEAELTDIARDFGACARTAINAKFRTTPSEVDETGKR